MTPFSLAGKRILITGASSGIGKAIAIECSKMGAQLIITGRDEKRLRSTYLNLHGQSHRMIVGDLLDVEFLSEAVENIEVIHGLVNCAGVSQPLPFKNLNREKLSNILDINFVVPAMLAQKFIKAKKIKKEGSIIFISSIIGNLCSFPGSSVYASTKGAINALAKTLAIELSPQKIRVNTIMPGVVNTDIFSSGVISEEQLEADKQKYPLKRFGEPEEIAYAAIYLLSDASKWVTGTNLLIDGGYTLL